ncbi:hypothetical protein LTR85_011768 [Meristemomyces frigidus]|nr:hypothetical protein LTR85_011768 [Meristemomyces frigidus]
MQEKDGHSTSAMKHGLAVDGAHKPWKLDTQLDGLRDALKGLEELWQQKDQRVRVLRTLSNPWPPIQQHRAHNAKKQLLAPSEHQLPEANAAPIPHATFRKNLAAATSDKMARQVLRAQLLRCEKPNDIQRVVAVALVQGRATRQHIAALHEPIMRALYRCRNNVDDQAILDTLSGIHSRFKIYDVPFDPQFLMLGLKFAARTRSLKGMKKYLKALRQSGLKMTSNVFRAIIAKFSIGHRGLGEIRNGRWNRSELLQVLTGFDDAKHLPPEQQYHLGCYLDRSDWQYLHGWIAVLARCKDADAVWHEWRLWKQSEARLNPKNLASMHKLMTTKLRGDYWFVEQMTYSGGLKEAWQILEETGIEFTTIKDRIKTRLLEEVEHCTIWDHDIRHELVRKYDADLLRIETALGVRWVPSGEPDDDAQGYHALVDDQEQVLDRLGADDWKFEEDYGYPYEASSPIVPSHERSLHDAAETTPAESLPELPAATS